MSIHAAKGLEFPVVAVADLGRRPGRPGGPERILHDPGFGLVCMGRDERGDWQKPASYRWAEWLTRRMEAAEARRLLYVACTRAADLLILAGKEDVAGTWLADIQTAWQIEPGLAGPVERAGFTVQVIRPAPPIGAIAALEAPAAETAFSASAGLDEMPLLTLPWRDGGGPARPLDEPDGRLPVVRPAVRPGEQKEGAATFVLDRVLHRVLADWPTLAEPEQLIRRLAAYARREGVLVEADAVEVVVHCLAVIEQLRRTSLYGEVERARERHTAVPIQLETAGGSLQGAIDLLYQDRRGGWHILDWKTESVTPRQLDEAAERYRPQMAAYSQAVKQALELTPQAAICFLGGDILVHSFGEL
jgi:ATP-dependent helicase/nuclease subunit A